ncbi:putative F-box protein [Senna tora]|uniref:Putative F-box protein n=1 Tax=Senna tora TaxID=362788 RepID=A0A834TNP1_9FABA|nr:putative F-box protein [Senna tora]
MFLPDKANKRLNFRFPVFHKGAIHFLSFDPPEPYILSYNIESGISTTLDVPRECIETLEDVDVDDIDEMLNYRGFFRARIFKWENVGRSNYDDDDDDGSTICLVRFDREKKSFGIWVLMDYEKSFWSKLLELSFEEMGLGSEDFSVFGYSVMNGNSLVFCTKKNVFCYDLSGQRKTRLERICSRSGFRWRDENLCFFPYSSTFRSCGNGEKQLYLGETGVNFVHIIDNF